MKFVTWVGALLLAVGLVLMLVFTSPLGLGLLLLGGPLLFFGAAARTLREREKEQEN